MTGKKSVFFPVHFLGGYRGRFSVSLLYVKHSQNACPLGQAFFGGAGKRRKRLPSGGEEPMTASGGNLIDSEVI
jgi:hypothetical protein